MLFIPQYRLFWPNMTEGWVDCPSLGPGWQRREVLRKNGTRPGHSDTYYMSPRGEKIRSRVELNRLLGCSRDLTDFDFRKGIFLEPNVEVKKSRKRRLAPLVVATHLPRKPPDWQVLEETLDQKPPELEVLVEDPTCILSQEQEPLAPVDQSIPKPRKRRYRKHLASILAPGNMGDVTVQDSSTEETIACCASCQGQFPGVMLPSQRRCRWLCPDCRGWCLGQRAQRRDFNREQRYYKQIGCGVCQACQMSQDCGICRVCVLQAKSPELRISIKCLLRRCLKIVKKGLECGMCQACKITEDCGSCYICVRRQKPGMKRQWKCLKRRCLKRKKKIPPKKDGYSSKKLTVEATLAKDTFTPVRRRQKQPATARDGPPPKAQRAPKRRQKRLSAPSPTTTDGPFPKAQMASGRCHRRRSATTKWKPTMERSPGSTSAAKRRKKQLGAVKERKKAGRPPKHPTIKLKNSVSHMGEHNAHVRRPWMQQQEAAFTRASASRRNRKCGECEACLLKMDCGRCDFCCDKPKFGGKNLKRQKCRWRQCLHFAMNIPYDCICWEDDIGRGSASSEQHLLLKRLLPEEWSSPEAEGAAAAGWKVRRRRNAFGGRSRKPARIKQVGRRGAKGSGQKRRAKASFQPETEESPSGSELIDLSRPRGPEMPEQQQEQQQLRLKEQPERANPILAQEPVKDRPILPERIKEEPGVPRQPTLPTRVVVKESDTRLPAVNFLIATSPKIKQEHAEPGGDRRPSNDSPVSAGLPQYKRVQGTQGREVVVLDDEEDDEVEQLQQMRPPVIMEIYSLGGMQPLAQLDSVLREFLAELNEIPLPAHWEVLPPLGGPNLRLVQRSKHSTMSAAVIHIRPGLFFHVVVRDLPVPPEHELYASHPARLTTVDEVVELICNLEAYRLCPGWPAGWHAGERSQACDVLVYSGCCPQCRLNPWPSGSGTR
ncbi:methyl-CpG-binding domain protein 1 isoform X4 [Hemicordylus capensis]|uniref:methyl-CpG-binding domain protein 1 isoform X4 n=1 Tax=Hemicordylus capensis TaxID=884348 RepID=UPI0023047322|nr:methyl-CpG-binding domain protein 1 isoform X4 [Hemicordylus capensis]